MGNTIRAYLETNEGRLIRAESNPPTGLLRRLGRITLEDYPAGHNISTSKYSSFKHLKGENLSEVLEGSYSGEHWDASPDEIITEVYI